MILLHLALFAACSLPSQDTTLPALHTLKDKNIASVIGNDSVETITVNMKDGQTYVYRPVDWDLEDDFHGISKRVSAQIRGFKKVFTKCEVPPAFPGGESAWDAYLKQFCLKHKREISQLGGGEVVVQCVVHLKGQVVDAQPIQAQQVQPGLADLAVQAVKEAPAWVPASQNGWPVVAYMFRKVRLE